MTRQSDSSSTNTVDQSKIDQMIARGRDLEEGEVFDLAEMGEQESLVEALRAGKLTQPGVIQHASYLAELQVGSDEEPEND